MTIDNFFIIFFSIVFYIISAILFVVLWRWVTIPKFKAMAEALHERRCRVCGHNQKDKAE